MQGLGKYLIVGYLVYSIKQGTPAWTQLYCNPSSIKLSQKGTLVYGHSRLNFGAQNAAHTVHCVAAPWPVSFVAVESKDPVLLGLVSAADGQMSERIAASLFMTVSRFETSSYTNYFTAVSLDL